MRIFSVALGIYPKKSAFNNCLNNHLSKQIFEWVKAITDHLDQYNGARAYLVSPMSPHKNFDKNCQSLFVQPVIDSGRNCLEKYRNNLLQVG